MKKFVFSSVMAVVFFALFAACSRQTAAEEQSAAELRYGFTTEPSTLDPLNPANTADGRSILFNVFEGLVKPDTEGRLQPCLAESWTVEQDGLVYGFKLRENVRFHDGSPLDAYDVAFTLETAAAAKFTGIAQIEKIETPGSLELRITLKAPDPEFLPYLAIGIVKAGSTNREQNINGTGPYRMESHTVQQSLVLRRFKDYWQQFLPVPPPGSPPLPENARRFEKVTIVFLADTNALLLGLKGGGIDGASVTGAIIRQLETDRFTAVPGYSASVQLLALNNAVKPLDDIRVRQAINYATDLTGIINAAFYGYGKPSGSPVIPGLADFYDASLADPYPLDVEKARSLLTEAGAAALSLEITVPSNYTMHVDTAQVIAGQLAKAGINVTIRLVDWAAWFSDVYQGRKYQATVISLDAPNVSARSFLSRYRSDSGSNFINFKNAAFDRAFDAAQTEVDGAKRVQLYREAQRIISANAAGAYIQDIYYYKAFRGHKYGGVLTYPLYAIDFASMYVYND